MMDTHSRMHRNTGTDDDSKPLRFGSTTTDPATKPPGSGTTPSQRRRGDRVKMFVKLCPSMDMLKEIRDKKTIHAVTKETKTPYDSKSLKRFAFGEDNPFENRQVPSSFDPVLDFECEIELGPEVRTAKDMRAKASAAIRTWIDQWRNRRRGSFESLTLAKRELVGPVLLFEGAGALIDDSELSLLDLTSPHYYAATAFVAVTEKRCLETLLLCIRKAAMSPNKNATKPSSAEIVEDVLSNASSTTSARRFTPCPQLARLTQHLCLEPWVRLSLEQMRVTMPMLCAMDPSELKEVLSSFPVGTRLHLSRAVLHAKKKLRERGVDLDEYWNATLLASEVAIKSLREPDNGTANESKASAAAAAADIVSESSKSNDAPSVSSSPQRSMARLHVDNSSCFTNIFVSILCYLRGVSFGKLVKWKLVQKKRVLVHSNERKVIRVGGIHAVRHVDDGAAVIPPQQIRRVAYSRPQSFDPIPRFMSHVTDICAMFRQAQACVVSESTVSDGNRSFWGFRLSSIGKPIVDKDIGVYARTSNILVVGVTTKTPDMSHASTFSFAPDGTKMAYWYIGVGTDASTTDPSSTPSPGTFGGPYAAAVWPPPIQSVSSCSASIGCNVGVPLGYKKARSAPPPVPPGGGGGFGGFGAPPNPIRPVMPPWSQLPPSVRNIRHHELSADVPIPTWREGDVCHFEICRHTKSFKIFRNGGELVMQRICDVDLADDEWSKLRAFVMLLRPGDSIESCTLRYEPEVVKPMITTNPTQVRLALHKYLREHGKRNFKGMSCKDIGAFLTSLGLSKEADACMRMELDGEMLNVITRAQLDELDFCDVDTRTRFFAFISGLRLREGREEGKSSERDAFSPAYDNGM